MFVAVIDRVLLIFGFLVVVIAKPIICFLALNAQTTDADRLHMYIDGTHLKTGQGRT